MLTAAEYLAWERAQPARHELFDGVVLAKPVESPRHYALCVRAVIALDAALRGRDHVGLMADQQVVLGGGARYVYPDAGAVVGGVQLQDGTRDVIANPRVLLEVLSAGTERRDRGLKWLGYQRLPSLTDYVLVSQAEPLVEHYRRHTAGRWLYRAAGLGERLVLTDDAVLDVDAIFAGVFALRGE